MTLHFKKGPGIKPDPFPGRGETYRVGVQSCAGGSATPILVFKDGDVLKSNISCSVLAC